VPKHDAGVLNADTTGGLHKFLLLERKHLPADEARYPHPVDNGKGGEQKDHAVRHLPDPGIPQGNHHNDEEKQVRESVDDIREAHQEIVDPAAHISRKHANGCAHQQDDRGRKKAHHHGNACAIDGPAQHIPPQRIGTQKILGLGFNIGDAGVKGRGQKFLPTM
jgi:hypothetical protein